MVYWYCITMHDGIILFSDFMATLHWYVTNISACLFLSYHQLLHFFFSPSYIFLCFSLILLAFFKLQLDPDLWPQPYSLIIFVCPWIYLPLPSVFPNLKCIGQASKNLFGLYIFSHQAKYRSWTSVWILVGKSMRSHNTPRPAIWAVWVEEFHLGRTKA